ncbi:alkane 1-monooxygenase [Roseovarius sp. C7]|uniref:alkane 1-monooxygenase n=1 Tax=Roseovarius sp. C7 TaxID=3398643 RepID=UPI0039F68186
MTAMITFAIATVTPMLLVMVAAVLGGGWAWAALFYMTAMVAGMDRLIARDVGNAAPEAEFPAARPLLWLLGLGHFAVLAVALCGLVSVPGGVAGKLALGIATGLIFGQISHPVAHELIHQPGRGARLLGRLIYSSLLIGHHASAHLRVHHIHVGSDADPNTPRLGRGFYRYALSAALGSYRAGLAAESGMLRRAGRPLWRHPYLLYGAVAVLMLVAVWQGLGRAGVLIYVALCLHAQMQIYLSDYVQHYGLRRQHDGRGRLEPVGPAHSWNSPHWFSSALMINAPRHSDHHVTPSRPYPALRLGDEMPMLPYPVPVMGVLALWPPLWRRVMDGRARDWQERS